MFMSDANDDALWCFATVEVAEYFTYFQTSWLSLDDSNEEVEDECSGNG